MEIDWEELQEIGGKMGKDFLEVIKPYLPVLARSGPDFFEGFIKHLNDGEFTAIDALMYEKMTLQERAALEQAVYSDAYQATLKKFERKELFKEVAQKVLLRIVIRVATGGVL
jgi:hypothetical protein